MENAPEEYMSVEVELGKGEIMKMMVLDSVTGVLLKMKLLQKVITSEKLVVEEDTADANKDAQEKEPEEQEPEDKEMTMEEYQKVLEEKMKVLLADKAEERKVDFYKEFKSMQLLSNKKANDDVFIKLGYEKDKRKDVADKEDKKKSVCINQFLKPADGEVYNPSGLGCGRGRGTRGGYTGALEGPENRCWLSIFKGITVSKQNADIHTTIQNLRIIAGVGVVIVFPSVLAQHQGDKSSQSQEGEASAVVLPEEQATSAFDVQAEKIRRRNLLMIGVAKAHVLLPPLLFVLLSFFSRNSCPGWCTPTLWSIL